MFYDFTHRHTECHVHGEPDLVILSRETKSTTIVGKEYQYNGLFAPISTVKTGALVEVEEDSYLIQTLRPTTDTDKYCSMIKTNILIEVQRYGQAYDANDNPVGPPKFRTIEQDVRAYAQYVTAQLRQDDLGLLSTTVYTLQIQTSVDIENPKNATFPDRVILKGNNYQVDVVDALKYPNLLHVQLSEDRR